MIFPFAFISTERRKLVFWLLFASMLLVGLVLSIIGAPLATDMAPAGIISYELAGDITTAQNILDSWDEHARLTAALVQGIDFLFIPVYVATIGVGCGWAAYMIQRKRWPLSSLGTILAWAIIVAGIFDIIENIALIKMLLGHINTPLPQIAFWCAAAKFVLIILGLSYIAYGALAAWIRKANLN